MGTIAVGGVSSFFLIVNLSECPQKCRSFNMNGIAVTKRGSKCPFCIIQEFSRAEDFRVWQSGAVAAMKLSINREVVSPK